MPVVLNTIFAVTATVTHLAFAGFVIKHVTARPTWRVPVPDLIELAPGTFRYRLGGEFTRDGRPAAAPIVTASITRTLFAMRRQVSAADYRVCVDAGACPGAGHGAPAPNQPVVNVSWRDAQAYAAWLSRETGAQFRLPTDAEWVYAAGSRFADDALPAGADGVDPGRSALEIYDRDASRDQASDRRLQPIGSFGVNENGLLDVAGSVWEWTDTCFVRAAIDADGEVFPTTTNCGVRLVEGRHRTFITDFVRDARSGGCSFGVAPANLGFRLVLDGGKINP
jgi:formylglycine-generating enzyme required for sulfatase activity